MTHCQSSRAFLTLLLVGLLAVPAVAVADAGEQAGDADAGGKASV